MTKPAAIELHPYFEPEILAQLGDLKQQYELAQAIVEIDPDEATVDEPSSHTAQCECLDRLVTIVQQVRDEQRETRELLARVIAIIADGD